MISTQIIQNGDGLFGLPGWRVMFLIEGIPSVLLAIAVWFLLTDRPSAAGWMPQPERDALLGNLSGFVAPYVTGALSDATGNNRLGLWVVGICMVSAAVMTWMLRRTRNRPGAQVLDE